MGHKADGRKDAKTGWELWTRNPVCHTFGSGAAHLLPPEPRMPPATTAHNLEQSGALREYGYLERRLAIAALLLLIVLNVAFIAWNVATIPVRGMAAVALLGAYGMTYPAELEHACRRHLLVIALAASLAALGVFVSAVNGEDATVIIRALMEVQIQVVINLILATILVSIAGATMSGLVIGGVILSSAVLALLQLMDIPFAWAIRDALGNNLRGAVAGALSVEGDVRTSGLSYSPIQLATQLCLAFGVSAALWEHRHTIGIKQPHADPVVLIMLAAMCVGAIICATRSPVLGAVIFFALYALRRKGSWLMVVAMLGGAALYLVWPLVMEILQSSQPRMVRTDDNSATGRQSLFTYGLYLFRDNPLGYGFGFDPIEHWTKYWQDLYTLDNPNVVKISELHNYMLNMLNTYGVGLVLVAPLVWELLFRARYSMIFFIPYIVHTTFHNTGPFWNDMIFWYVVATLSSYVPARWHSDQTARSNMPPPRIRLLAPGAAPADRSRF
jgi:hypothetical protein